MLPPARPCSPGSLGSDRKLDRLVRAAQPVSDMHTQSGGSCQGVSVVRAAHDGGHVSGSGEERCREPEDGIGREAVVRRVPEVAAKGTEKMVHLREGWARVSLAGTSPGGLDGVIKLLRCITQGSGGRPRLNISIGRRISLIFTPHVIPINDPARSR